MKYFKMTDTQELEHAPKLKDWYGRFDVRDITLEGFPKLPDRELFFVESEQDMQFTDIIRFPFLLISPRIKELIKKYRELCFVKEVILLDQKMERPELYYLPVFDEIKQVQIVTSRYVDGVCVSREGRPGKKLPAIKKHIFWVREGDKRHTVISLDLAESLIRRKVTGLRLEEVRLYQREQEG